MPVALTAIPSPAVADPRRKRWARFECASLAATGLRDQQKVELIEGELIDKTGKNRRHVNAVIRMLHWLTDIFGCEKASQEAPIDVAPADNPSKRVAPLAAQERESRAVGVLG